MLREVALQIEPQLVHEIILANLDLLFVFLLLDAVHVVDLLLDVVFARGGCLDVRDAALLLFLQIGSLLRQLVVHLASQARRGLSVPDLLAELDVLAHAVLHVERESRNDRRHIVPLLRRILKAFVLERILNFL